jgi:hypothetical protein
MLSQPTLWYYHRIYLQKLCVTNHSQDGRTLCYRSNSGTAKVKYPCTYQVPQHIITCRRGYRRGFWIGWLDLLTPYTHHYTTYTHFAVHHYTRTRVLSLYWSCPGNGFIRVSLSLQITHEIFFAPPNSFLAIFLKLSISKTLLNSVPLIPCSNPGRLASRNSNRLECYFSIELFFITTLHGPRRKHSISIAGKVCLELRCIATEVSLLLLA